MVGFGTVWRIAEDYLVLFRRMRYFADITYDIVRVILRFTLGVVVRAPLCVQGLKVFPFYGEALLVGFEFKSVALQLEIEA